MNAELQNFEAAAQQLPGSDDWSPSPPRWQVEEWRRLAADPAFTYAFAIPGAQINSGQGIRELTSPLSD